MTNRPAKKKNKELKDSALIAQEERRLKEQSIAKSIEAILVENGMALQPFLSYSEYGIAPRVRLVEVNTTSDDKGTSEGEAPVTGEADTTTEPS